MIVIPCEPAIAGRWMAEHGFEFHPPYQALALWDGERICSVAVFNNYQRSNIHLSVVTDGAVPLTRAHLSALFNYPFCQLRVNRVTVTTGANNMQARKLIRRLGFKPEGKHPKFYGNEAAISYGLLRQHCKWLR